MKRYYFIYEDLRRTREELAAYLERTPEDSSVLAYIRAEYEDVEHAMKKLEAGEFGICEFSGELLPEGMLGVIPTAKTVSDFEDIGSYFKKPLY
ncbi:TraR/DksA C4-type zinc finger protein [Bacillus massilinigeriensis]|uniref:hypothetical protein n=1 Tax=Bacillus mediterraneensis TaxID=1805474 RepID=UPI0008F875F7|nr:hypothetical protein [Bacillus mediterraneensis]